MEHLKIDSDGKTLLESFTLKNGKVEGEVISRVSGEIRDRVQFSAGKRNGSAIIYHVDGSIKQSANFKDGRKHGVIETYDAKGKIILKQSYKNGKQDGITQIFESGN